jgi:hypothetical protein
VFNNGEGVYTVDLEVGDCLPDGSELTCLLTGSRYIVKNNRLTGATLPARTAAIIVKLYLL